MTTDTRIPGRSYGYVLVPEPGLTIDGVKFKPGPKAAGKNGWFRILATKCKVLTEHEYETLIKKSTKPGNAAQHAAKEAPKRGRRTRNPRRSPQPTEAP